MFVLKSGNGGLLGQSGISLPVGTVLIPHFTAYRALMIVITWTTGCALVMWLSELDHPARHRQRHVDPDLHVGRLAPAVLRARWS